MEMLEACLQVRDAVGCTYHAAAGAEAASCGKPSLGPPTPTCFVSLQPDPSLRPTATQLLAMPYFADPASWLSSEFIKAQVGEGGCDRLGEDGARMLRSRLLPAT